MTIGDVFWGVLAAICVGALLINFWYVAVAIAVAWVVVIILGSFFKFMWRIREGWGTIAFACCALWFAWHVITIAVAK